jgi:hypothetical protein
VSTISREKEPYQFVQATLTVDEAELLANTCETPTERLVVCA